MKKKIFLLSILLLLLPSFAQKEASRKRIAVLPFSVQAIGSMNIGQIVSEMFTTALVRSGYFDVIERSKLDALIQEMKFQHGEFVDPSTAIEMGKMLGVDYVLTGTVTEFGIREEKKGGILGFLRKLVGAGERRISIARVKFDYRIIDVRTGRIFFAETGEGEEKQKGYGLAVGTDLENWIGGVRTETKEWEESVFSKATRKAVDNAISKLSFLFSPEGKVIAREKKTVIVDIGAPSRIKAGVRLEAYRVHPIKDEEGNIVWLDKERIGEIRVVEVREDKLKGEIISETLSIRVGDMVSLPSR